MHIACLLVLVGVMLTLRWFLAVHPLVGSASDGLIIFFKSRFFQFCTCMTCSVTGIASIVTIIVAMSILTAGKYEVWRCIIALSCLLEECYKSATFVFELF